MRLKKWIARRGAVGGTARWAAKLYKTFKHEYPEKSDEDIFKMIIKSRYNPTDSQRAESSFFSMPEDMIGLRSLVTTILRIEAGYSQNSFENQEMFFFIIEDELQKKGINKEIIRGS